MSNCGETQVISGAGDEMGIEIHANSRLTIGKTCEMKRIKTDVTTDVKQREGGGGKLFTDEWETVVSCCRS